MIVDTAKAKERREAEIWYTVAQELKAGRWFVAAVTLLALSLGVWSAMTAPKTYEATAVIAPKKAAGGSGVLSQLGGLGSMLSSQMGMMNTGNERMAFTLGTREVIGRVITGQGLIPKLYPDLWDGAKGDWKSPDSAGRPSLQEAIELVRENALKIMIQPKKELIYVTVSLQDSAAVAPTAAAFLKELNESIKGRVRMDAEANRVYLEEQLATTSDPLLREKLQALIAGEIEKAMLVGSWAFDVLEPPVPPLMRTGPNRKRTVLMAFSAGLVGSAVLAIGFQKLMLLAAFLRRRKPA